MATGKFLERPGDVEAAGVRFQLAGDGADDAIGRFPHFGGESLFFMVPTKPAEDRGQKSNGKVDMEPRAPAPGLNAHPKFQGFSVDIRASVVQWAIRVYAHLTFRVWNAEPHTTLSLSGETCARGRRKTALAAQAAT